MADEVNVITNALRDEGRKWRLLSDDVPPVRLAVERLTLEPTAFFIGDINVQLHWQAYDSFHRFIVKILGEAQVEFEQLGTVLGSIADRYDEADELIALDLNKVYSL